MCLFKLSVLQTGFLSQLIIFSIAHTLDIIPEGPAPPHGDLDLVFVFNFGFCEMLHSGKRVQFCDGLQTAARLVAAQSKSFDVERCWKCARNLNTFEFLRLRGGTEVQWDAEKLAAKRRLRSVPAFSKS